MSSAHKDFFEVAYVITITHGYKKTVVFKYNFYLSSSLLPHSVNMSSSEVLQLIATKLQYAAQTLERAADTNATWEDYNAVSFIFGLNSMPILMWLQAKKVLEEPLVTAGIQSLAIKGLNKKILSLPHDAIMVVDSSDEDTVAPVTIQPIAAPAAPVALPTEHAASRHPSLPAPASITPAVNADSPATAAGTPVPAFTSPAAGTPLRAAPSPAAEVPETTSKSTTPAPAPSTSSVEPALTVTRKTAAREHGATRIKNRPAASPQRSDAGTDSERFPRRVFNTVTKSLPEPSDADEDGEEEAKAKTTAKKRKTGNKRKAKISEDGEESGRQSKARKFQSRAAISDSDEVDDEIDPRAGTSNTKPKKTPNAASLKAAEAAANRRQQPTSSTNGDKPAAGRQAVSRTPARRVDTEQSEKEVSLLPAASIHGSDEQQDAAVVVPRTRVGDKAKGSSVSTSTTFSVIFFD
jgi:hypothetical protein